MKCLLRGTSDLLFLTQLMSYHIYGDLSVAIPLPAPPPTLSILQSCALQTCTPLSDNCLNCLLAISSQTVVLTGSECNADCPNITFVSEQPPASTEGGKLVGRGQCVVVLLPVGSLSGASVLIKHTYHMVWYCGEEDQRDDCVQVYHGVCHQNS